jgi:LytS/YehU family sensor histidine kinase
MPEGESAPRSLRRLETKILLGAAAIGVLAVGLTAYFIGGPSALGVAIGLVVLYGLVGALPAIGGVISRANRNEKVHKRVVQRVEGEDTLR